MRKLFKVVFLSLLVVFVGLPCAFLLFVMAMTALGIVLGVGGAIVAMMFAVLKIALLVLIPLALCYWAARVLFGRARTY
jgi:hypothetical protein